MAFYLNINSGTMHGQIYLLLGSFGVQLTDRLAGVYVMSAYGGIYVLIITKHTMRVERSFPLYAPGLLRLHNH